MQYLRWLWRIFAGTGTLLMFGSQVGPDDVVSNLSKWAAKLLNWELPPWLKNPQADEWFFWGGATLALLGLGILAISRIVKSKQAPAPDELFMFAEVACYWAGIPMVVTGWHEFDLRAAKDPGMRKYPEQLKKGVASGELHYFDGDGTPLDLGKHDDGSHKHDSMKYFKWRELGPFFKSRKINPSFLYNAARRQRSKGKR